ncbi:MAG: hypothetical protein ACUVUF_04170 [Candidatus Bathycorpusculaceae bacterium]
MTAEMPMATIEVMLISLALSFSISSINRLLISKLVGWQQYRVMQKEIAEYQAQATKALRTKDKKLMEKIKKKEPQIKNMQMKMLKPQLILFGLSFIYFFIWPILVPMYSGSVAYIPGISEIPFIYWYMICSMFFGVFSSRIVGTMPIE